MSAKKILLVETDEFYVEVIETFIKLFLQQQLVCVRDLRSAHEAIQRDRPDLILLDIESDSLDVLELSEALRDDCDTKRVPILAISHSESMEDEALGRGCDAFLTKPFRVRALESVIARLLDQP